MSEVATGLDRAPEILEKDVAARRRAMGACLWVAALARVGQATALAVGIYCILIPAKRPALASVVLLGLMVILEGLSYSRAGSLSDSPALGVRLIRAGATGLLVVLVGFTFSVGLGPLLRVGVALMCGARQAMLLGMCRRVDLDCGPGGFPIATWAPKAMFGLTALAVVAFLWQMRDMANPEFLSHLMVGCCNRGLWQTVLDRPMLVVSGTVVAMIWLLTMALIARAARRVDVSVAACIERQ